MNSRLSIVVLGYVIRYPIGGMSWSNRHYLMGLQRLGHEVWYLEDSDDYPSCYDPARFVTDCDPTYGLTFGQALFEDIGFGERWAYHDAHNGRWLGPASTRVPRICREADVLLNLACSNPMRPWLADIPVRAYVDEDPAFTQIRGLTDAGLRRRSDAHNVFFSFGENIANGTARIPDDGNRWQATRQPVVTEVLRPTQGRPAGKLTTVMQWKSYEPLTYGGNTYGVKAESFVRFFDLPQRLGSIFEIAMGSASAPRAALEQMGWMLRDPMAVSRDTPSYEDFIAESKAEFGIAKEGYVSSHSGWFSERSCCYMALGRPVLLQDTGFTDWLPAGTGVMAFSDPDDLAAAVEALNSRYQVHCQAARDLVEAYFGYHEVLTSLLERALSSAPTSAADPQQP